MNTWPPVLDQYPDRLRQRLDKIVSDMQRIRAQPNPKNSEIAAHARAIAKASSDLLQKVAELRHLDPFYGVRDDNETREARQHIKESWDFDEGELKEAYIGTHLWRVQYPLLGLNLYMQVLYEAHACKDSRQSNLSRHAIREVIRACSSEGIDLISRRNGDPIKQLLRHTFDNINCGLAKGAQLKPRESEWYPFRRRAVKTGLRLDFYTWHPKKSTQ